MASAHQTANRRRPGPAASPARRAPAPRPSVTTAPPARADGRLRSVMALWSGAVLPICGLVLLALGVYGPGAALLVVGVALVLISWRVGAPERLAAAIASRPVEAVRDARLSNVLDGLCVAYGLPVPTLRILEDPVPNMVTLGRDPARAVMICTSGLLTLLDRIELEGVIAHELAHLKRGDTEAAGRATRALGALVVVGLVSGRAVAVLGDPTREVRADAAGVALTRYPPGLYEALVKLSAALATRPAGLSRPVAALTAASWLVPLAEAVPRKPRPGALDLGLRASALAEL